MECVLIVIMLGLLWIVGGLIGWGCIQDEFYIFNPLWAIPIVISGPISILIWMGIVLVKGIKSYIQSVKDYYRRKRDMESRKRRSVWGDYHENR